MTNSKEYNQKYYETVLKNKLQEQVFCEACNKSFKRWNLSAHKKSEKHKFNLLPDEEKEIKTKLKNMENEKRWLSNRIIKIENKIDNLQAFKN